MLSRTSAYTKVISNNNIILLGRHSMFRKASSRSRLHDGGPNHELQMRELSNMLYAEKQNESEYPNSNNHCNIHNSILNSKLVSELPSISKLPHSISHYENCCLKVYGRT